MAQVAFVERVRGQQYSGPRKAEERSNTEQGEDYVIVYD